MIICIHSDANENPITVHVFSLYKRPPEGSRFGAYKSNAPHPTILHVNNTGCRQHTLKCCCRVDAVEQGTG